MQLKTGAEHMAKVIDEVAGGEDSVPELLPRPRP